MRFCFQLLLCLAFTAHVNSQVCTHGDIRLAGGPNEFEGRVEYCLNDIWGHACGNGWGGDEGRVACRQLGYESSNSVVLSSTLSYYGAELGSAFVTNINCVDGTESTLDSCSKQEINETAGCSSSVGGFAYLMCEDPECEGSEPTVRLTAGMSDSTGRVEVCDNNGRRRQVCETGWDDQDAAVVCRALGFQDGQGAVALIGQYQVSAVRLPVHNNVECLGNEQYFSNCSIDDFVNGLQQVCAGFAGVMCSDPQPTPSASTSSPTLSVLSITSTLELTSQVSITMSTTIGVSSSSSSELLTIQPSSSTALPSLQSSSMSATLSTPDLSLSSTSMLVARTTIQSSSAMQSSAAATSIPVSTETSSVLLTTTSSSSTALSPMQLSSTSEAASTTQLLLPSSISTEVSTQPVVNPSSQSQSISLTELYTQASLPSSISTATFFTSVQLVQSSSTPPFVESSIPVTTGLPTTPGPSDNSMLIIVVGSVGGVVAFLLLLLLILFMLILLRRNRSTDKYTIPTAGSMRTRTRTPNGMHMYNGDGRLPPIPPIPMDELERSTKKDDDDDYDSPAPAQRPSRVSSNYDHVLLNPLYTDHHTRSRSNTIISDQSSVFEDPGYTEIKGMARKESQHEKVEDAHSASIPSDLASQRSHSPMIRVGSDQSSSRTQLLDSRSLTNRQLPSRPFLDEEGYAALGNGGAHVYDQMSSHFYDDINQLPASMRNNLVPMDELLLATSPYETSAFPAYNGPDMLRGSLLSPNHKSGTRSNPNLSSTTTQRGFLIPPQPNLRFGVSNPNIHEYRDLEEITSRTRSWYDSPTVARAYEDPLSVANPGARAYEDPTELAQMARAYESPMITVSGEDKNADYPNRTMELKTIPEYETLDS